MFGRKKAKALNRQEVQARAQDGTTTFVTFEMMAHKDVGCAGCEGVHIGVGLHGCRPNLHKIPEEKWTAAEFLAYEAAEEAAAKMKFTGSGERGMLQ